MRYQKYLRERYRILFGYTGGIVTLIGVLFLVPLAIILFYPQEVIYADSFLLPGIPLILIGLLIWQFFRPKEAPTLSVQEGAVIVVITWTIAILVGTIPFLMISGLSFSQAVFEATSGFTTTGLSVVDVVEAPQIILFYRSLIQLAGGAGFAIIALSAITGSISAGLVTAEGRTDQLAPNVRHSANIVLTIYTSYVLFGIAALRAAGMNWFDAVNHSFAALSTGGFSTRVQSIGYWDSPAVEAVTIVLMLLGTINFGIAYAFFQGKFRYSVRSGEMRLLVVLLTVGSILLITLVTLGFYPTVEKSVRVAIFEVTSAVTTTGFATVDYRPWPPFGFFLLIILMFIGGQTGSTAGGVKQLRIYILYKAVRWELRKAFLPRHIVNEPSIWQGQKREILNDQLVRQTAIFVGLYLFLFILGSGVMMIYGYSVQESLFEFASTLGTVGLSVGVTGASTPTPVLWVQCLGMILGRLEIFTVMVGIVKLIVDLKSSISHSE